MKTNEILKVHLKLEKFKAIIKNNQTYLFKIYQKYNLMIFKNLKIY